MGKRKAAADPTPPPAKKAKIMTAPPTAALEVYVFGEGSSGELGLGNGKKPPARDVKRPRLNPFLSAAKVGVVAVEAGGMHSVAITRDNKILTWGVNDQGALGRDTNWEGGMRDMDADPEASDDDDENGTNGLNPIESTPGEVDFSGVALTPNMRFTQITAGDSCSFALTDDGKVYGWGTFRGNDGIIGFTPEVHIAYRPVLIKGLKDITSIKAGDNHCYALDSNGKAYSWGCGQQDQLGRRIIERTAKIEGLKPRPFGLPSGKKDRVIALEAGAFHGFALTKSGDVYSWGLNSMGETGHPDGVGLDNATVRPPKVIKALKGKDIVSIQGGTHHSIAATRSGECYAWGLMDSCQTGIPKDEIAALSAEDMALNDPGTKPKILKKPMKVTAIKGAVTSVAAASDQCMVITKEGKAWAWGFSTNYQTGLGTDDEVEVATLVDNTAVREKKLNKATLGGQFGILTAVADVEMVNGPS